MQSLSWQLWKLWGNVGGRNAPLRDPGAGAQHIPSSAQHSACEGQSEEEAVIWPDFPASLERPPDVAPVSSHVSAHVRHQESPASCSPGLSPRALKVRLTSASSRSLLPPPLEPMGCQQQSPRTPDIVSEPYLVILTQWSGSILETGNVNHQNGWVLLPPGGRVCCFEHNSPLQWGTALYPAMWTCNLGHHLW